MGAANPWNDFVKKYYKKVDPAVTDPLERIRVLAVMYHKKRMEIQTRILKSASYSPTLLESYNRKVAEIDELQGQVLVQGQLATEAQARAIECQSKLNGLEANLLQLEKLDILYPEMVKEKEACQEQLTEINTMLHKERYDCQMRIADLETRLKQLQDRSASARKRQEQADADKKALQYEINALKDNIQTLLKPSQPRTGKRYVKEVGQATNPFNTRTKLVHTKPIQPRPNEEDHNTKRIRPSPRP